jgi:hypothetical protein
MKANWRFEEGIDDSIRAWLTKALEAQVTEWLDVTEAELGNRLDKHGKNRTEASLYCTQLTAPGLAGLEYLCLLACERDKAEPTNAWFLSAATHTRVANVTNTRLTLSSTLNARAAKRSSLNAICEADTRSKRADHGV